MRTSLYAFIFILFSACAPKAWTPPHKEPVKDPGRIPNQKNVREARRVKKKEIKAREKEERKTEKQKNKNWTDPTEIN